MYAESCHAHNKCFCGGGQCDYPGTGALFIIKRHDTVIKDRGESTEEINPALKIDGVLLTLADMRTNFARATAESLKENYGKAVKVYQTVIPVAVKAAETSASGKSIYRYDKNGTAAKAYEAFTKEVLRSGEKERHKHETSHCR